MKPQAAATAEAAASSSSSSSGSTGNPNSGSPSIPATPGGAVKRTTINNNLNSATRNSNSDIKVNPVDSGSGSKKDLPEVRGWLYKWTNYIKGYQKRWFVLTNGLLSYYRTAGDVAYASRGTISVQGASIQMEDSSSFIISNGGGTQTFHLRANSESERQKWITALEISKTRAMTSVEEDDDEALAGENATEISKQELVAAVKELSLKLEELDSCAKLISRHSSALFGALNSLNLNQILDGVPEVDKPNVQEKVKTVHERATLLKITSSAMIKSSSEFVKLCTEDGRKWQRIMTNEREIRQRFEDMVEQYAQQHSNLETMMRQQYHLSDPSANEVLPSKSDEADNAGSNPPKIPGRIGDRLSVSTAREVKSATSNSDSDDDFHDALDDETDEVFTITAPPWPTSSESLSKKSESSSKEDEGSDTDEPTSGNQIHVIKKKEDINRKEDADDVKVSIPTKAEKKISLRQRRTRIPDKPNISISLWSILKNCIGKDLTKIPVPVNFSEPLSMLQRITEDYEYSEILDKAASCKDDCEQMAYVAAFTVSAYSTTAMRSSKPFNPLLGETFELDRSDDKGFRCISEQVSHHPPMLAQYCESTNGTWKTWQEFSMRSKFKGKFLEVEPLGISHLLFPDSGNHYTWRKVKTVVHNIVIGRLWIDQHGEMSVINHNKDIKCHMKFEAYSYFGGTPKKVTGSIVNDKEKVEWVLNGTWDSKLEGAKVINETVVKGKTTMEIGPSQLLFKSVPIDPGAEKYYSFTRFACELNELEPNLAPTDSRLRPDQRMMEEAEWDEANREKVRLEEKQRAARRAKEEEANIAAQEGRPYEGYQPVWFKREPDLQNGEKFIFSYTGGYWEAKEKQDWSMCPDIY